MENALGMCGGRFKRRSDKRRIAEGFAVSVVFEGTFFDPRDYFSPQSVQPAIYTDDDGDRQIQMMRWAFKFPDKQGRSSTLAQRALSM